MADFVTLRFDRKKVDALNLREPLFALEQMITSATLVREFAGRVRIAFDGYDDAGEVFLDSGVQRYMRELTDLFPYWLHFADKNDSTLEMLMACLQPPQRLAGTSPTSGLGAGNISAWKGQVRILQRYMDRLHAQFGLTEAESAALAEAVIAWSIRVGLTDEGSQADSGKGRHIS